LDREVKWFALLRVRQWNSGNEPPRVLQVVSRPSLVFNTIFSTFDLNNPISATLALVAVVIVVLLCMAVYISIYSGIRMTRTITRATADLDEATGRIETGDFSHRIPIRTKDQLSKLAASFNHMTENIQRLILEVQEKEKLESELVIAREVQAQLYPKKVPQLKTLELTGYCSPARVVSGDYFDFVTIDQRQTALAIGDVSGKGISAALLMATIQSSLRAQLTLHGAMPEGRASRDGFFSTAQLVAMLNQQLHESTTAEKFASFCLGVYDEPSGRLLYTNAGHLPPILIRRGEATRLEVSGMVLGVLPNTLYDQNSIQLEPGDLLVAFSDGITEPENEYGEEFGEQRLIDLLIRNTRKPLDELATLVTDTVVEWARFPDQRDDMTLVLARRI
jgi:sigma-B regulation protein RsbU (phosphoserine phosphatase)